MNQILVIVYVCNNFFLIFIIINYMNDLQENITKYIEYDNTIKTIEKQYEPQLLNIQQEIKLLKTNNNQLINNLKKNILLLKKPYIDEINNLTKSKEKYEKIITDYFLTHDNDVINLYQHGKIKLKKSIKKKRLTLNLLRISVYNYFFSKSNNKELSSQQTTDFMNFFNTHLIDHVKYNINRILPKIKH